MTVPLTNGTPAAQNGTTSAYDPLSAPFPKRKVILNVGGTWVGEKDGQYPFDSVHYWTETAKLLERGKFHGLFIADSYGFLDTYGSNISASLKGGFQIPKLDPAIVVGAMSTVTTNLAFGITSTTTYEPAFALARRFTTLDHMTNGRVAWNIVTSALPSAARNFGLEKPVEHDLRYEMADEYMDVVYKLWESSWHDNAVKRDKVKGIWTDPALVRPINHKGKYFKDIPGPFGSHPSPQRTPALYQAGSSGAGTTFGAKHAEAVFISQPSPQVAQKKVAEYRAKVAEVGRDPRALKSKGDGEVALAFTAGFVNVDWAQWGEDEEIVLPEGTPGRIFLDNYKRAAGEPGAPWTRNQFKEAINVSRLGAVTIGSPKTVADKIEEWVTVGDVDGFNLSHYARNDTFEDIIELLVPELQRRGLFWEDYPEVEQPKGALEKIGISAREGLQGKVGSKHLDPSHYGYRFKWIDENEKAQ
ncbi:hypothetical protein MNV49_001847 [Pseudohyphozyma bogoriensis]|nr:hypothetical protein MNV49_001847 [Pseudohyphozyma bogoriensis]